MFLYLTEDLFSDAKGELNMELFIDELKSALEVCSEIILLHPIASVAFDHIIDTCPRELQVAGLLRCVAVQLQPGPFEVVSANSLGKMLHGKVHQKAYGRKSSFLGSQAEFSVEMALRGPSRKNVLKSEKQ